MGDVSGNAVFTNCTLQNANREIGVPGFQLPASTSEFRFNEFTFAPFHRPSLNPARAPVVSAVLSLLEAELLVSAERLLAVFQIDAGGKSLPSLWPAAQISPQGSVAREVGATGPPVDALAVAGFVAVVGLDVAVAVAVAAVAAAVVLVVAIAVVPPAAAGTMGAAALAAEVVVVLVVAVARNAAAVEFVAAVVLPAAVGMVDAAALAAVPVVVLVVAVARNAVAVELVVAVGPVAAAAVAPVAAFAALARRFA